MNIDVKKEKEKIRKWIWETMEKQNIARFPRPVYGRIPNFVGADKAAENLRRTKEWYKAETVFVNPDSPQKFVRLNALLDGKKLYMASPRIKKGFLLLDPKEIPPSKYSHAVTIKGAFRWGKIIDIESMTPIDMKVTGCVAVDTKGGRLGKGHGYSDIEWGILSELGLVDESTITATTVHDVQVVDSVPHEDHDFPIDIIATPTRIIYTKTPYKKPKGLSKENLSQLAEEIPLIRYILQRKRN